MLVSLQLPLTADLLANLGIRFLLAKLAWLLQHGGRLLLLLTLRISCQVALLLLPGLTWHSAFLGYSVCGGGVLRGAGGRLVYCR